MNPKISFSINNSRSYNALEQENVEQEKEKEYLFV